MKAVILVFDRSQPNSFPADAAKQGGI